jgi:sarcosine oxidase subunit beta
LNGYGLGVEALTPGDVLDRVPEIDCVDGVAGGTFSPLDGVVDSASIKFHYQEEAKANGATFLDRWFVTRITQEEGGWRVSGQEIRDQDKTKAYLINQPGALDETLSITARVVVNAAGPWAARIAKLYGDDIPSKPQRRQVFYVKHPGLKFESQGMIVDDSGAFIQHLVGGEILCGFANPGEPMGYRFEWDGPEFYREWVLPRLARRISIYPEAELIRGWARLYDHSPDRSGMVGRVKARPGLFQAHSFSGHGVMQSYGAGQALSELITEGRYKEWKIAGTLDPYRFEKGETVFEPLYI